MVTKASLQSSKSPSGVATYTPSCACSNSMRYFSSAACRAVVSCTTWMVPFCWPPCSAYDEVEITDCPPKHGSIPSVSPEPRSQYGQALQQGLICLEDSEVRVVRQNQILDGIEGIHPLVLRAQHLLQQPQILNRDPQLLGGRFQKLQFFLGVVPTAGAAERQHPNDRLLAQHWQQ